MNKPLSYTPGPWFVSRENPVRVYDQDETLIADCDNFTYSDDGEIQLPDCEGNARLIAAAPEMHSALKNALATLQAVYQWIDRVNDAGGATSISGVAACNAMLKSLNGNRDRFQKLIVDPGNAALRKARGEA